MPTLSDKEKQAQQSIAIDDYKYIQYYSALSNKGKYPHWIDKYKEERKDEPKKDSREKSDKKSNMENFEKTATGAIKETEGKNRLDLLPFEAVMEVGKVYTDGATKYSDHNWRKGLFHMKHHIAAALRHIFKFAMGQDRDEETGHLHTAHAIFHLMAVTTNVVLKRDELDDRVTK